jgi:putative transposase
MRRGRPPRLAKPLYVGLQRYSLTFCCHERRPLLTAAGTCALVLRHLLRASEKKAVAVFAYCAMPDHLHVIAEGETDQADCLEFARLFKQTSAYEWKQQNEGERLWQVSFYDRVLRDDESTQGAVRYVLENPVRKELVISPGEYRPSGSLIYDKEELIEWAFGTRSS